MAIVAAPTARAACTGDCNDDGRVTMRELVLASERGVGKARNCPSADADGDGMVVIEELVRSVSNASDSCQGLLSPTPTISPTPVRSATPTRSPTSTSFGPQITAFGLARADNTLVPTTLVADNGARIFTRSIGAAFIIYLEARPGTSGVAVGSRTTAIGDPRPDLQILVSRPLGNGSPAVCDDGPVLVNPLGGVPAVDPPDFDPESTMVTDALIDFGCRFEDSTPLWCTLDEGENPNPVTPGVVGGLTQFCSRGVIGNALHFPSGDTTMTAQVRDLDGNIGNPVQIIIRVP